MKFKTELKLDKKFDVNKPPKGAWIQGSADQILLGASTVNRMLALGMTAILGLIIGFLANDLISGEYSAATPFLVGISIVFFFPFFLIIAMALGGKVVVIITEDKCKIFRGIGRLGISKTVDLNTLSIGKRSFIDEKKIGSEWELRSKKKGILTKSGLFGFLEEEPFMYLLKSVQKIVQDKDSFLPEDLSEHLL